MYPVSIPMRLRPARAIGAVLCLAFALAAMSTGTACNICKSRDVLATVTVKRLPGEACPSLDSMRASDPALDEGPIVVDAWTTRCCYTAVVASADGGQSTAERCEEHEVRSDWDPSRQPCPSREYRSDRPDALDGDGGIGTTVSVIDGPRETRTPTGRLCAYSKVVGQTSRDACG